MYNSAPRSISHRIAVLDQELCQPRKCGLECIAYCPVNKTGGECIVQRPKDGKAVISEELCTGCGICVKKCPFEAIVIVNLAKELGENKIHQYGVNTFRLYRLPSLKKNSVIGIIGRNGIGKSTIINIMSGNLKPNLGKYHLERENILWDQILEYFQGTELKSYFEKIAFKTMRASVKPQLVTHIPKIFKGTAKELLQKYDERKVADKLVEDLQLRNSIDKDTRELSGGELQRLAIAVAAAKDADYYFFDEPSSYNDVYQRMAVARVIQDLACEQKKNVIVAEHDMALLDYISDNIHILYGEPGAYGIVSDLLGTKIGINNFLGGFIPTENIRFREKAFRFDITAPGDNVILDIPIARYSDITRSFSTSSFSLKVSSGQINRGEIVGILGANALGKTCFMKVLAAVDKGYFGDVEIKARISYKPQYLSQQYDGTVRSLLDAAYEDKNNNNHMIKDSSLEEQVIIPLGIVKLYEKNVRKLSGGELQKVAVAASLLRQADIYALDEPSAFLDAEDRIALAKFLHRYIKSQNKSAIIADHDLQLIDLVADSLIIFEGNPGVKGFATAPMNKKGGMNRFLRTVSMTFRRDESSGRPRINKEGSRLDREQKETQQYYYTNT